MLFLSNFTDLSPSVIGQRDDESISRARAVVALDWILDGDRWWRGVAASSKAGLDAAEAIAALRALFRKPSSSSSATHIVINLFVNVYLVKTKNYEPRKRIVIFILFVVVSSEL